MTHKFQCPACRATGTEQAQAFELDDPCPACGCPARVWREVQVVQQSHADAQLKERCELLLVENANLSTANERFTAVVVKMRALLDEEIYG